jgi:endonuclease/exonuclease/phosphatase family metal-dependent hydrolase
VQVRVVVYNVRGFRDGLNRVANVVRHFEPDVVLLNESGPRRRLRRFAREVGMHAAADPWSPLRRRVKDAVLVRAPLRVVSSRLHRFPTRSRVYPRGALLAQLGRAGYRFWAVAVHLGLTPAEATRHAEELADLLRGVDGPVLVGGDLNSTPDRAAVRFLSDRFWDAWLLGGDVEGDTFPAEDPTARIDYLFVSEGVAVERVAVPGGPDVRAASDHRPVVAQLTLPEGGVGGRRP